ncbi:MAG: permease [Desulfohalobiaceae bacterium]
MWIAFGFLLAMSLGLFFLARKKGDGSHVQGLRQAREMFVGLLPLLLLAFTLAGLLQVAVPPETIQSWLGEESGWKGIVIGTFAGSLILGGPYAAFPVISSIYELGAGLATVVAMITGWALLGMGQLIMGLAFIGLRFTALRTLLVLIFPFLAGGICLILF